MKIVSVMTTPSPRGGAEFAAVEMLDALVEHGHDVVMLSDKAEIVRESRVPVRLIDIGPKLSVRSYPSLAARTPQLVRRLSRALRAEMPYDVLLVHYKKEQLLAPLLPPELRRVLVWAEWGPVPYPMRRGLPRRLFLAASRGAGAVIAISRPVRRHLIELGLPSEKVVYVPNVMRTEDVRYSDEGRRRVRARLGIPDDAFVVGCISRFHPKKRNDVVVEGVLGLADPRVHLVLAGEGETEAALRAQAQPLRDRAHFIPTPGEDVGDVASAFDVAVFCPSPTEGEPRAIILGALAARPCVSTGSEGAADMITPAIGRIVSPDNDAAALTGVLRPYLDDPARRAREGAAAREWAETKFAVPVVAAQTEALLVRAGAVNREAVAI